MPAKRTVSEIMAKKLITLSPNTDLFEAMGRFLTHRISGAPVVDEKGKLVGVLSEKDCMKILVDGVYFGLPGAKVADYMSREVKTVGPEATIMEVADIFLSTHYRRLPVVEGDTLVGQVSRRDVLRAIHEMVGSKEGATNDDPLEGRTRQGPMTHDAGELREVVGPETNKKFGG